jgi:hypothetical protein
VVGGQFGIQGADAPGQPDRLGAADRHGGVLGASAPGRDRGDGGGGQRLAGVDAEVDGAQQRGQRADGAGAFAGHLLAGHGQHPQCGARSGGARPAQLLFIEAAHRLGDRDRVQGVALAGAAPTAGRNVGCLGHHQLCGAQAVGEHGAVGAGAVDDHQRRGVLGVSLYPGDGAVQPGSAGRKSAGLLQRAGGGGDQRAGVGGGVGVDADDEFVGVCDDGHGGASFPEDGVRDGVGPGVLAAGL